MVFQFLDDVDGIVGVHAGDDLRHLIEAQPVDHAVEDVFVEFGHDVGVEVVREQPDKPVALVARQPLDQVGGFGMVEALDVFPHIIDAVFVQSLADGADRGVRQVSRNRPGDSGFGLVLGLRRQVGHDAVPR